MAISFPSSPAVNDTYSVGNKTWQWDGISWNLVAAQQLLTTKGDLLYASANSTPNRLAIGAVGKSLNVDPGGTGVPAWTNGYQAGTNAQIPAGSEGMAWWDTTNHNFQIHNGVAWRAPWNMPWGIVSLVTLSTTNQTGIAASTVDITGASITFTAVANRRYKTTLYVPDAQQLTSAGTAYFFITDGANTVLNRWGITTSLAGSLFGVNLIYMSSPSAGSVTYKARAQTSAGTLTVFETSTEVCYLMVEDIGPSSTTPA